MTWNKFDPNDLPDGDTFWRIDATISSVAYHHGYYWYREGIYSYLLLFPSYAEEVDILNYDGEDRHLSPSMLVERNAHWIYPHDIGFPDVIDDVE